MPPFALILLSMHEKLVLRLSLAACHNPGKCIGQRPKGQEDCRIFAILRDHG